VSEKGNSVQKVIPGKYLIFLGDVTSNVNAKTGFGLVEWRPEMCVAQWSRPTKAVDLGLPEMAPEQAFAAGARTMVIGVAPAGGAIEPAWRDGIVAALRAGLDVASGMHARLSSVRQIAQAARDCGRQLFDVRHGDQTFGVGTGRKRSGMRLLTVGTDCVVGKKYTALSIAREMNRRGMKATFRATGQTGILIAGSGVAIDAVVADFVAGAAEWLSPDNARDHWDVIEGQGSLFHPSYAGVSTGLLHGSQPDAIVLCHDPSRQEVDDCPGFRVPDLGECIDLNLRMARLTNPDVRCVGISVNTSGLPEERRAPYLRELAGRFDLPCFDPIATGTGALVDQLGRVFGVAQPAQKAQPSQVAQAHRSR
jgi:uncharacterized NAD-dependent epimerase/dehydratase family protein